MRHQDLRKYVIRPVLQKMADVSGKSRINRPEVEDLLIMTAAVESHLGEYLHQYPTGPALGIYQMEPETHDDIWNSFIVYRGALKDAVLEWSINKDLVSPHPNELMGNLYYATAMARVHYWRIAEPIPTSGKVQDLAEYWDTHWNRNPDPRTGPDKAVNAWHRLILTSK